MRKKLLLLLLFIRLFLFCYLVFACFVLVVLQKFFLKKNNKQTKSCPDSLIYYTTGVHPPQLLYGKFICMFGNAFLEGAILKYTLEITVLKYIF